MAEKRGLPKKLTAIQICLFCLLSFSARFRERKLFIIMYVNINRYLKIYLSIPPFIIYYPRANTWEKTKDKKDIFAIPICENM